ncbi:hypothetical protein HN011_006829 [Eciton burchellii]|nr:hypothetical protein HN011_006829 [Eciton burchellii]
MLFNVTGYDHRNTSAIVAFFLADFHLLEMKRDKRYIDLVEGRSRLTNSGQSLTQLSTRIAIVAIVLTAKLFDALSGTILVDMARHAKGSSRRKRERQNGKESKQREGTQLERAGRLVYTDKQRKQKSTERSTENGESRRAFTTARTRGTMLPALVVLLYCICPISLVIGEVSPIKPMIRISGRIIGGEITSIKKYPFLISVQRRFSGHTCGGTYIAPRFVLSATHCMIRPLHGGTSWTSENPHMFYVIAGATYVNLASWTSMQIGLVDRILPHAKFRYADMQNDIGLFRLSRPLYINTYVQYMKIPSMYLTNLFDICTKECTAVGWGRHTPDLNKNSDKYLRHVQLPLIPPAKCFVPLVDYEKQLCAGVAEGRRDTCQGDSGGPLLCNGVQVGIVSWGIGCARPDSPGIYTRVDYYLGWLNETIIRNGASTYLLQHTIISNIFSNA